jgi:hypothetical protein
MLVYSVPLAHGNLIRKLIGTTLSTIQCVLSSCGFRIELRDLRRRESARIPDVLRMPNGRSDGLRDADARECVWQR